MNIIVTTETLSKTKLSVLHSTEKWRWRIRI